MKNIRHILITACILTLLSSAAYADTRISVFDAGGKAVISGTAKNTDDKISVSVFNDGKTAADADAMVPDSVVYVNQIMPDKDKTFNIPISLEKYQTGEYTLSVYQNGEQIEIKKFPYAEKEDNRNAIAELNKKAAEGKSAFADFIEQNRVRLEFSSDYDAAVSLRTAAEYLIKEAPFDTEDKEKCVEAYKKSMLAQAFADGKIDDIRNAEENIDALKKSPLKEVYGAKYVTDKVKTDMAKKLTLQAPYGTLDGFDNAVSDALILAVVNYPTGYGDIGTVIRALRTDFPSGILTDAKLRGVANKSYGSVAALKTALENVSEQTGGGNGGGTGGGGGSSKSSGTPFGVSSNSSPTENRSEDVTAKSGFTDMDNTEWAKAAVEALAKMGIVSGRGENKFCPGENITREEFVKMCVMLFEIPSASAKEPLFEDMDKGMWYYPYIKTAYGAGLINGVSDNRFGIGLYVSRQDAAVILDKCMSGYELDKVQEKNFSDSDEISDYAVNAVENMCAAEIISGYEDGSFRPKKSITRAEAAKLLFGTYERIGKI